MHGSFINAGHWIPAFAGMTGLKLSVAHTLTDPQGELALNAASCCAVSLPESSPDDFATDSRLPAIGYNQAIHEKEYHAL